MSMSETYTSIANQALSLSNHNEYITSIDDNSSIARMVKLVLNRSIRQVCELIPWNELRVTKTIIGKGVEGHYGQFESEVPNDLVRIVDVSCAYARNGNKLITTQNAYEITYISDDIPPSFWSASLTNAVIYQLALNLPSTLSSDQDNRNRIMREFQGSIIPMARHIQRDTETNNRKLKSTGRYVNRRGV